MKDMMSSIEDLTEEVSDRKMQGLIPLLGEKYSEFRIQVWIPDIRNRCNAIENLTVKAHYKGGKNENETKTH